MEPDHLEGKRLHPVIGQIPEGDGQIDLPKWHGLLSRQDAMERCFGRSDARSIDAHGVECLCVHDVEAAAPSISTLVSRFMLTIGSITSGYLLGCVTLSGWLDRSKVMGDTNHLRKADVAGLAS